MHQAEGRWAEGQEEVWCSGTWCARWQRIKGNQPRMGFSTKEQCPFSCCYHGAGHRAQRSQCPRSPHTLFLLLRSRHGSPLVLRVLPATYREEAGSYWEMSLPHPCARWGHCGGSSRVAASGLGRPARRCPGVGRYPPSTVGANSARGVHVPASCPQPGSVLRFSGHGTLACLRAFEATATWSGVPMPSGVTTHRFHE